MRRLVTAAALLLMASGAFAQSDNTKRWLDTLDQQWQRKQQKAEKGVRPPSPAQPACNGPLAHPIIQRHVSEALALVKARRDVHPSEALNAFDQILIALIRRAEPIPSREHYTAAVQAADINMQKTCFYGLTDLLVDARQKLIDSQNATTKALEDAKKAKAAAEAEARKP